MVASDLTPVDNNVAMKHPKVDGQQTLPDHRRVEPSLTEKISFIGFFLINGKDDSNYFKKYVG